MDRLTPSLCCRAVTKAVTASLVLLMGIALGCGPKKLEPQEEATAPDQPGEAGAIAYLKRKGASLQRNDATNRPGLITPYWIAHVSAARVTDADFKWFQQIRNLKNLIIGGSSITDQGLAAVAGLDQLKSLSLSHLHRVNDAGIDRLTDLGTLESLWIEDVPISDAALKRFGRLQKLKQLTLWKVPVTGTGFAALAGLKQLEELDLSGSPIEDAGCAELARLPALRRLDLASTRVGNAGMRLLAGLPALNSLNLTGTRVSDEGVRLLSSNQSLEGLTLDRTGISDEALLHIPAFPRLRSLGLWNTSISDKGLEYLRTSKLTGLDLRIARNGGITDQGLHHLQQIKTLKKLRFEPDRTGVTEDGMRELARALPNLQITRKLEK